MQEILHTTHWFVHVFVHRLVRGAIHPVSPTAASRASEGGRSARPPRMVALGVPRVCVI